MYKAVFTVEGSQREDEAHPLIPASRSTDVPLDGGRGSGLEDEAVAPTNPIARDATAGHPELRAVAEAPLRAVAMARSAVCAQVAASRRNAATRPPNNRIRPGLNHLTAIHRPEVSFRRHHGS